MQNMTDDWVKIVNTVLFYYPAMFPNQTINLILSF